MRIPTDPRYRRLVDLKTDLQSALSSSRPSLTEHGRVMERYHECWTAASVCRNEDSRQGVDMTAWVEVFEELRQLYARALDARHNAR